MDDWREDGEHSTCRLTEAPIPAPRRSLDPARTADTRELIPQLLLFNRPVRSSRRHQRSPLKRTSPKSSRAVPRRCVALSRMVHAICPALLTLISFLAAHSIQQAIRQRYPDRRKEKDEPQVRLTYQSLDIIVILMLTFCLSFLLQPCRKVRLSVCLSFLPFWIGQQDERAYIHMRQRHQEQGNEGMHITYCSLSGLEDGTH
jgi:hypothetical protein